MVGYARFIRVGSTRRGPHSCTGSGNLPRDHPGRGRFLIAPIVFVHGVRTSSAIWDNQVAAMALSGHESIAVDLPGHGSRSGEQFTLQGALDAIDQAVATFSVPPLLVGLSLGGYSALAYAARNDGKLAGVVLAGCSTEMRGKPLGAYRSVWVELARRFRPAGSPCSRTRR